MDLECLNVAACLDRADELLLLCEVPRGVDSEVRSRVFSVVSLLMRLLVVPPSPYLFSIALLLFEKTGGRPGGGGGGGGRGDT